MTHRESHNATPRHAGAVARILRTRRGRAAALSGEVIAAQLEIGARQVQHVIKWLVEVRHVPIGTTTSEPHGYFLITTLEERREVRDRLRWRALSILRHAAAYDSDGVVAPLAEQLQLQLGGK